MTIAADLKEAAEDLESAYPGAHVICIAIDKGVVALYAKSPVINDKMDAVGALDWIARETLRIARRDIADKLNPPTAESIT